MNYLMRAEALGQDVAALKRGQVVTSRITVNSIAEYRAIFAAEQSDVHRKAYTKLRPAQSALAPEMQLLLDHVFGEQELTPKLDDLAQKLFPVTIVFTSADSLTFDTDVVIGPNGQSYGLNVGALTFDGGSLTVNSTVSTITADNLVITPNPSQTSTNPYHIGIVGNQGAQGATGTAGQNSTSAAATGNAGNYVIWGTCTSSGIGQQGGAGAQGDQGGTGANGSDGLANLNSAITISAFDPSNINAFVVATYSGAGGTGGVGGLGGSGQNGGTGGAGCNSGCEGSDGGAGGPGGKGGTGGTGGNGGSGVQGSTITINFPQSSQGMLSTISSPAPAGSGGPGGPGGPGGAGGAGGTGGKHNDNGVSGAAGATGNTGAPGNSGTSTGAPGAFSKNFT